MTRIEKRFNKRGQLEWACGPARDIHTDCHMKKCRGERYRIPGTNRWFLAMLPRHKATWEIEGLPPWEVYPEYPDEPPFERWSFVLIAHPGPQDGYNCLALEVGGAQLIEVAVQQPGQPSTK